jgi:hypothetical protein
MLALSKNPPVFARQANIAPGPQQINNTMSIARAGVSESAPNELLEAHDAAPDRPADEALTRLADDGAWSCRQNRKIKGHDADSLRPFGALRCD